MMEKLNKKEKIWKKIKILEVSKWPQRSVYIFEKSDKFMDFFSNLCDELGLEYSESEEDNIALDIEENKDGYYNIKNGNYDVDVYVGGEEIVLVIRTSREKQQEVSDKVFKFVEFKE